MSKAADQPFRFGLTLTLMMGVGPAIMFAMSALGPYITTALDIGRVEFGFLATVAYVAAVPGSLMAGRILRLVNPRTTLLFAFLMAGIALLLVGVADSLVWLVLAAMLSGVIQSVSNPVTNVLVSFVPSERTGRVMGVKQAGVQMAQLTAGLLPILALAVSWRLAVVALIPVTLVASYLALTAVPSLVVEAPPVTDARRLPAVVWWLLLYSFFIALSVMATNVYLPLFGVDSLGIGASVAGSTMILSGALGMLGRIGWGRATDSLSRHYVALAALAAMSCLSSVVFAITTRAGAPWMMWLGVGLHGVGAIAANVVVMHAVITVVERHQVAAASGYQGLAQYLGFALGPIAFGALVEATDGYLLSWCASGASYLVALGIAVLALRSAHVPRAAASSTSA